MSGYTIGKTLMIKGKRYYTIGKTGIISLYIGVLLEILICGICFALEGRVFLFDGYLITSLAWIRSFFLIASGLFSLPFFFFGLQYIGLGKICKNTEK